MPEEPFEGSTAEARDEKRALARRLEAHVRKLATELAGRGEARLDHLAETVVYIESELTAMGHEPQRQTFEARGTTYSNVEVEIPGTKRPDEIVVVGAHFDVQDDLPGADDNASGTAVLLELARRVRPEERSLRLVFFTNEEQPHAWSDSMGSNVHAKALAARKVNVVAMMSLEMLGYYTDEPGSQKYPAPLSYVYPDRGNFIGFVGNVTSRALVRRAVSSFRRHSRFPSEGAALPEWIPGIGNSDHWSYWRQGYPALMVTDTAFYRNPNYHTDRDLPETLDYDRMADVALGLSAVIADLTTHGAD